MRHSGLRNDLRFFSLQEWGDCRESLDQILSQEPVTAPERIVQVADEACDHIFDLLGSGLVHLGEAIQVYVTLMLNSRLFQIQAPWASKADANSLWELHQNDGMPREIADPNPVT